MFVSKILSVYSGLMRYTKVMNRIVAYSLLKHGDRLVHLCDF